MPPPPLPVVLLSVEDRVAHREVGVLDEDRAAEASGAAGDREPGDHDVDAVRGARPVDVEDANGVVAADGDDAGAGALDGDAGVDVDVVVERDRAGEAGLEHDDVTVARAFGDVVEAAGAVGVEVGDGELGGAGGARGDADQGCGGAERRRAGREDGPGGAHALGPLLGRAPPGAVQGGGVEIVRHEVPLRRKSGYAERSLGTRVPGVLAQQSQPRADRGAALTRVFSASFRGPPDRRCRFGAGRAGQPVKLTTGGWTS